MWVPTVNFNISIWSGIRDFTVGLKPILTTPYCRLGGIYTPPLFAYENALNNESRLPSHLQVMKSQYYTPPTLPFHELLTVVQTTCSSWWRKRKRNKSISKQPKILLDKSVSNESACNLWGLQHCVNAWCTKPISVWRRWIEAGTIPRQT